MHSLVPAPDAVWSRYGDKRHLIVVLIGVVVFAALTALGCRAFVNGDFDGGAAKTIDGVVTGLFVVGLLFCGYAAVVFPFRRRRLPGVAIDAAGIWWCRDRRATLVPWAAVAGVGVGFLQAPAAAVAAGSSSGRRKGFALEVFLRDPNLPGQSVLRQWSVAEPFHLRFVMPTGSDRHHLHAAVARFAPQLWLGEYEREWTPLGMLGR